MVQTNSFVSSIGFPIYAVSFSQDDKLIAAGGGGAGRTGVQNKISMYDIDLKDKKFKLAQEAILEKEEDAPMCLSVHPKKEILVCGINSSEEKIKAGKNTNCRVFAYDHDKIEVKTSAQTLKAKSPDHYQKVVRFSPEGNLILSCTTNGEITLLKYPSMKYAFDPVNWDEKEILDADFDSTGKQIALITEGELRVLSTNNGSIVQTIENPVLNKSNTCIFRACRFGKKETKGFLYSVVNTKSRDRAFITKWDTHSWDRLGNCPVSRKPVTSFCISDDGKLLAFGTSDMSIIILDANSLRTLKIIPSAHGFPVTSLSFNRDSTLLVSGSVDNTCRVIEIPDKWPAGPLFDINVAIFIALVVVVTAFLYQIIPEPFI
ncbi:WD40 repeat-like protein [Basidiobolus meristosporus CBS 931.73]|uniref:WD40 repeat-like protein n=1 Tax=Basidiobolus meristosporus CBS 931.73 TaxID=1314790 RepID=A0A1Y1XXE2_9FUNG|nr:WD40 repeat-like protein [Basidiobolus meristosporus CBS 931.73]ORX98051.1 WD40 repeat-like protein [Basidiobolus meristosporus CBS 931.73]|eukprot:ORX90146.1 WD40 repeat-like protein [Basidiobolus meristosporus CBS 931.73]